MTKLRVKSKPVTVEKMENDNLHCCRWCHWFDGNYCFHDSMSAEMDGSIVDVEKEILVRDGKEHFIWSLSGEVEMDEEVEKTIRHLLDIYARDVLGVEVFGKVRIENPGEHYCREFF